EIEPDAALVAVDTEERPVLPRQGGGIVAEVVALGRLDLDDEGAQVAEQRAAIGSGQVAAQVEHGDAGQGPLPLAGVERRHRDVSGWRRRSRGPSDRTPAPGSARR